MNTKKIFIPIVLSREHFADKGKTVFILQHSFTCMYFVHFPTDVWKIGVDVQIRQRLTPSSFRKFILKLEALGYTPLLMTVT